MQNSNSYKTNKGKSFPISIAISFDYFLIKSQSNQFFYNNFYVRRVYILSGNRSPFIYLSIHRSPVA